MKKVITLLLVLSPTLAFADGITNGIGIAGDSIYKYTPAVQSLGYIIACIIGIVGAFSIYYAIQNNDPHTRKKILTYAGSCFTMVAMSISLPQFFAYKESGLIAGNQGTGGTGGTGSQVGGDNYDDIITDIPPMNHPSWKPDPQFPTKPGDVIIINPGGDLQLPPDFEFRPVTKPGDQPILKPSESKKIDI